MKKCMAVLAFALLPSVSSAQTPEDPPAVIQQVVIELAGPRERARIPATTVPLEVRYILIDPGNAVRPRDDFTPLERTAVLMLFIGGDGTLELRPEQINTGSQNFLARNRHHFAAEGFVVALIDAATDFNERDGGLLGHRRPDRPFGGRHLHDLSVVMADLRMKYPGIPLWAVGNSRGTVSAAVTGLHVSPPADGLVLTSSFTGPNANEELGRLTLESFKGPVLIVSHEADGCAFTRPPDSEALIARFTASEKVQFKTFDGGSAPISNSCDSLAPHGFFGVDQKVVEAISRWIRGREEDAKSH
jgi:hypothetical protein